MLRIAFVYHHFFTLCQENENVSRIEKQMENCENKHLMSEKYSVFFY